MVMALNRMAAIAVYTPIAIRLVFVGRNTDINTNSAIGAVRYPATEQSIALP